MTTEHFSFDGGKYMLVRHDRIGVVCWRHGELWPAGTEQFMGNKLLHAMLDTITDLQQQCNALQSKINEIFPDAETRQRDFDMLIASLSKIRKK